MPKNQFKIEHGVRAHRKRKVAQHSLTGVKVPDMRNVTNAMCVAQVPIAVQQRFKEICHEHGTTMRVEIIAFMCDFIRVYGDFENAPKRTNHHKPVVSILDFVSEREQHVKQARKARVDPDGLS